MTLSHVFPGLFSSQQSATVLPRLFPKGKFYSKTVLQNIISGKTFKIDSHTNITPTVISRLNRKLFNVNGHPISLLKDRIIQYIYRTFRNNRGNPIFSCYDDLSPVVTAFQNFDSLLVPESHPSRSKSDCFYINQEWMLRSHMTAHQSELIKMGLNNFLMVGDVYRNDAIDSAHYPVFHQLDGVRLLTAEEVGVHVLAEEGHTADYMCLQLLAEHDGGVVDLEIKEKEETKMKRTVEKQETYTVSATRMMEVELKKTLEGLLRDLFGGDVKYKWSEAMFPFTHPSWELYILLEERWIEVLGCGVVEHKILESAGCLDRIGWAFGLGLDRLAMIYYSIPDIRIFWSQDSAFLRQFKDKTWGDKITFKKLSVYPSCHFDLSFWLGEHFSEDDFRDVVREHCGEIFEHMEVIDSYVDPKSGRQSRCYRVFYRSMHKTLTKKALADTHKSLEKKVTDRFKVEVR